jgi:hypothetical protein
MINSNSGASHTREDDTKTVNRYSKICQSDNKTELQNVEHTLLTCVRKAFAKSGY